MCPVILCKHENNIFPDWFYYWNHICRIVVQHWWYIAAILTLHVALYRLVYYRVVIYLLQLINLLHTMIDVGNLDTAFMSTCTHVPVNSCMIMCNKCAHWPCLQSHVLFNLRHSFMKKRGKPLDRRSKTMHCRHVNHPHSCDHTSPNIDLQLHSVWTAINLLQIKYTYIYYVTTLAHQSKCTMATLTWFWSLWDRQLCVYCIVGSHHMSVRMPAVFHLN